MTTTKLLDDKLDAIGALLDGLDGMSSGLDYAQALRMIRDTADSALTQAVAQARAEGSSWADVARMLGTTRQAAQQRYT